MPFQFYQGPQPDSLNPAYEMLFRAAEARRNALAAIPGEVGGALDEYVKSKQVDRGQQLQANEQEDVRRYRDKTLGLEQQKLDMEHGSHDHFQRAMAAIDGWQGGGGDPGPAGPAFGGRTAGPVARGPVTAESILRGGTGGGMGQPDPADLAGMTPSDRSHFESILNTRGDNARQDASARQKQQTEASDAGNYNALIGNAHKQGILTDPEYTAYRMRGVSPEGRRQASDEVTKRITAKADEAQDGAKFDAQFKNTLKQAKSDFKDSPDKIGQIASFETMMGVDPRKAEDKAKELSDFRDKLYGVGKEPKQAPGQDIVGVGKDWHFTSSLKNGGEYQLDKSGNPILADDADAELTGLARQGLKDLFSGQLLQIAMMPEDKKGSAIQAIEQAKNAMLEGEKLRILKSTGNWQEAGSGDPIKAMDAGSARQASATQSATPGAQQQATGAPQGTSGAIAQPPNATQPATQQSASPLSELSPEQTSEAQRLLASGDKAKLREYLIQSRVQNQTKALGSSAVDREWLKRNPEPKWWWDMNSGYSAALQKSGFKTAAAAHKAWEKAKAAGDWGTDTPWAGKIGAP